MKKMIAVLSVIAMAGSAVSCSGKESSSEALSASENSSAAKKTIGIAMPTQELERWNHDGEYLKTKFEEAGYTVYMKYSENDSNTQNSDIKEMIDAKVDFLLIAAVDGSTLSDTLAEAKAAEIPVVAYDRLIMNTDAVSYYISFDNYSVGVRQGEYVRDMLDLDNNPGPYNIEFVGGDSADNNAKFFFNGAYDTLEPYIEKGKVIVLSGKKSFEQVATKDWLADNARDNMKKTLELTYNDGTVLDAVVCANDSTAFGVAEAIGSDYEGSNVPIITGQDGDIANLKNIVDGKQSMTVYKNVSDEAGVAFDVSQAVLSGQTPDAKLLRTLSADTNFDTGSYDNGVMVVPSYLLTPSVITKDDLQQLVDTGLYKWDSANKYLESVE